MKSFSKLISVLFHPIFLATFGMAYILFVSQNVVFDVPEGKALEWFGIVGYNTLFMPLLVILLLRAIKFLKSLEMENQKDRYIPLIACMSFYFWVFWIFHFSLHAPGYIQMFLLSSFITMVFSFFLTIFSKISLHLAGAASVFTYAFLLNVSTGFVDALFLIVAASVLGLVWYSRKTLNAHNTPQLITGAALGALASVIAYFIY